MFDLPDEENENILNQECSNEFNNFQNINKNENNINKKIKMDDKKQKDINDDITNFDKLNNEKKKLNENNSYIDVKNYEEKDSILNNNNSDSTEYDESEPEDEYDFNDPHFKKYPDEFRCYNCYETNVEKQELFDYAQQLIYKNNDLEKLILDKDKIIKSYKKENNKLIKINNDIKSLMDNDKLDIDFLTDLNDRFMELFLITHKSFDYIKDIILTIEKSNPKKVPEIINKNINKYRNEIQNIADEADDIRKRFLELNTNKFGDKLNIKD
jgi:hypothetical protein